VINELFDDTEKFINYFEEKNSQKARDSIIKTDKLRYW